MPLEIGCRPNRFAVLEYYPCHFINHKVWQGAPLELVLHHMYCDWPLSPPQGLLERNHLYG